MLDLLSIALEAHSDERNHHRRYEVSVGRDLLGHWTIVIRYGRAGAPLRELRLGDPDGDAARAKLRERLHRRLSAPKRIGCPYRLVSLDVAQDFDCRAWMPPALLGAFLR